MPNKKHPTVESVRANLRKAFEGSGMTQEDIGVRMGMDKSGARTAVSRLLNPSVKHDPRLSTLLEFAKAVNKPLNELIE